MHSLFKWGNWGEGLTSLNPSQKIPLKKLAFNSNEKFQMLNGMFVCLFVFLLCCMSLRLINANKKKTNFKQKLEDKKYLDLCVFMKSFSNFRSTTEFTANFLFNNNKNFHLNLNNKKFI